MSPRPPAGYFTKRLAEAWLREVLDQPRARPIEIVNRQHGMRSSDAHPRILPRLGDTPDSGPLSAAPVIGPDLRP